MGGGGLNVAYLRTADFGGGLKSGLIWLTFGGFLDFYSGNTGQTEAVKNGEKFCVVFFEMTEITGNNPQNKSYWTWKQKYLRDANPESAQIKGWIKG